MNHFIRNIISFLIVKLFGKHSIKYFDNSSRLLCLYFHNPKASTFESVIDWLRSGNFIFLSSEQLFNLLQTKEKPANKRYVHISLDDAWKDNLCNVLPVIDKYEIPVTIFVATEAVELGDLWINIVRNSYEKLDNNLKIKFPIKTLKRLNLHDKSYIYDKAKKLVVIDRYIMNEIDVKNTSDNSLVTIGGHTHGHNILTNLAIEEAKSDILHGKRRLEEVVGLNVDYFAYPNGNFNEPLQQLLKTINFKLGFTTVNRPLNLNIDSQYSIPRICIPDSLGYYENIFRILFLWRVKR